MSRITINGLRFIYDPRFFSSFLYFPDLFFVSMVGGFFSVLLFPLLGRPEEKNLTTGSFFVHDHQSVYLRSLGFSFICFVHFLYFILTVFMEINTSRGRGYKAYDSFGFFVGSRGYSFVLFFVRPWRNDFFYAYAKTLASPPMLQDPLSFKGKNSLCALYSVKLLVDFYEEDLEFYVK